MLLPALLAAWIAILTHVPVLVGLHARPNKAPDAGRERGPKSQPTQAEPDLARNSEGFPDGCCQLCAPNLDVGRSGLIPICKSCDR